MGSGGSLARCLFCDESGVKLSKEHLFHESFGKRIPHSPMTRRGRYLPGTQFEEQPVEVPSSMFAMKVGRVCATCNSGWMNDADLRIEEQIVALANADAIEIAAQDVASFALWATKVALLRTRVDQAVGWDADPELFRTLYETRMPPPGTVIRVGLLYEAISEGGSNSSVRLHAYRDDVTLADHESYLGSAGCLNVVGWSMGAFYTHVVLPSASASARRYARMVNRQVSKIAGPQLRGLWPGDRRPVRFTTVLTRDVVARIGNAGHLIMGTDLRPSDYGIV